MPGGRQLTVEPPGFTRAGRYKSSTSFIPPPSALHAKSCLPRHFCSGATRLSGRFTEGFSLRRLHNAALQLSRPRDAADLFLTAGRSVLLRGDPEAALPLLKRAEELARQTGQQDITEEVGRLRKLATVPAS